MVTKVFITWWVLKKSDSGEVKMTVDMPERLTAPIEKGEVVGEVIFSTGKTELGRVEIVAKESVDGMSFGNMILAILGKCALIM